MLGYARLSLIILPLFLYSCEQEYSGEAYFQKKVAMRCLSPLNEVDLSNNSNNINKIWFIKNSNTINSHETTTVNYKGIISSNFSVPANATFVHYIVLLQSNKPKARIYFMMQWLIESKYISKESPSIRLDELGNGFIAGELEIPHGATNLSINFHPWQLEDGEIKPIGGKISWCSN